MTSRIKQASTLINEYVGKKVVADLDGRLFENNAATFGFRFVEPPGLRSEVKGSYGDYMEGWNLDQTVPVAAVSVAGQSYEFAWLFLDWSKGGETPRVLVTTSDRWKLDDRYAVASFADLSLRIAP